MPIMPVSTVGFGLKNNVNINFEGRKTGEKRETNRGAYVPIKSIPVAALIAMSPMTNVNKVYADEPVSPKIELATQTQQTGNVPFKTMPKSWQVVQQELVKDKKGEIRHILKFINTDSDASNFELVEFISYDEGDFLSAPELKRMIVTDVLGSKEDAYWNEWTLCGIQLDTNDPNNYAPSGKADFIHLDTEDIYTGSMDSKALEWLRAVKTSNSGNCLDFRFLHEDEPMDYGDNVTRFQTKLKKYKDILNK